MLAAKYPNSTFHGFDLSEKVINEAKENSSHLKNLDLHVCDIYNLPSEWKDKFDFILIEDVLHDLPKQEEALKQIHDILKPGGRFSLVEYNMHSDPAANREDGFSGDMYTISMFYCLSFSLHCGGTGTGIGWGHENAVDALKRVGFNVEFSKEKTNSPLERHILSSKNARVTCFM